MARPQHGRGARRAAPRRVRVPARGRPAGREGAAAVRARRVDDRPVHRQADAALRAAVPGDAAARDGRSSGASCWSWAPTCWCSGRWRQPRRRTALAWSEAVVFAQVRDRRQHDRVRRAELGARRRGRAGGRSAPARAGDGAGRRARCPVARPADGLPAREHPLRERVVHVPRASAPVLDGFDLTIPAGIIARDRRPERRGQDDAGQAAVPPVRPAVRARSRSTASTCASSTSCRGARG